MELGEARTEGFVPPHSARSRVKLLIPAKIIDFALGRDAKKNLY